MKPVQHPKSKRTAPDLILPLCPHCKNRKVVRRGMSPTQHRGKQQRYLCRECKKSFILDVGFWKMKTPEVLVTKAVDLYFTSLSSRKVRNQYRRHEVLSRSHVTILDWCRKYALKVHQYADTLTPTLGGRCYADDTQIDRGGTKDHFWACVDFDTKYINAIHYSTRSGEKEAAAFLRKTKKALPRFIQTDAAMFYPLAFNRTFYVNKLQGLSVEHRVNNVQKTRRHNVRIETLFSKIKDRVRNFRGLKALWSAPILMAGIAIQHNHIEAHTTTGKIPAELAMLTKNTGGDRWRELIAQAAVAVQSG